MEQQIKQLLQQMETEPRIQLYNNLKVSLRLAQSIVPDPDFDTDLPSEHLLPPKKKSEWQQQHEEITQAILEFMHMQAEKGITTGTAFEITRHIRKKVKATAGVSFRLADFISPQMRKTYKITNKWHKYNWRKAA